MTLLLFILAFDSIFLNKTNNISRIDGIILVVLCIIYIIFLVLKAKKQNVSTEKDTNIKIGVKIVLIILGIAGIVAGGQLVVNSATKIALNLGMSEKLVGLTIVAIGTSLPELVTSAMAAYKGENEIALGNVIGSNIFNIILILGLSSIISPINVQNDLIIDFIFLIFITLLIYVISFWGKSKEKNITRLEGIIFVILYVVYMVYIIIRN